MAKFSFPDVSHSILKLRRISRILWVRVALLSALSVAAALSAELIDPLIPEGPKGRFTAEATLPILNILANGMLAVATFSLGVMVASHRTMAEQTTPRIHRLLMEDTSTQTMLATFIGAFAFSLASIILFRAGYYSDSAAVVVFGATVFVVVAIIVSLVRWIHQLSRIGGMSYALERAETNACETLCEMRSRPHLGGRALDHTVAVPAYAFPLTAPKSGFLTQIDMPGLQQTAQDCDARIYIDIRPGDRVLSGDRLARIDGKMDGSQLVECFEISPHRSYEQDPRYALQALRETASKALSPGINDPGTAVEVVARLERLLWDEWLGTTPGDGVDYDRLYMQGLSDGTLIATAFRDISRDGAGFVDVLLPISHALAALTTRCDMEGRKTIKDLQEALDQHAKEGLSTQAERERFRAGRT